MDHSDKSDQAARLPAARAQAEDGARQIESVVKAPADRDDSAPDAERLKKINELKKAVADGTYHVSAQEVAPKVIEHMLESKD